LSDNALTKGSAGLQWRPELDVLRFFAFLAVFVHHALPATPALYERAGFTNAWALWITSGLRAGAFGVDLFFCLSAYLITEILLREVRVRGAIDVRAFWIRRILRIWPLYFAALLLARTVVPLILPGDHLSNEHLGAYVALAGNWSTAILGYPNSVVGLLWSVSIEEQFYLLWPLLLTLAGRHRLGLVVLMLAISFGSRLALVHAGTAHPGIWCNTLARLDPIAAGALVAFVLEGRRPGLGRSTSVLLGVGGLFLTHGAAHFGDFAGPNSLFTYPAVAMGATACLVATLGLGATWLENPIGRFLVWLGKVSFGLYVFHVFALGLSSQLDVHGILGVILRTTVAFVVTVLLAAISYRWLEAPFLKLKSRFSLPPTNAT
jgi:peptidoglycan/LPS O-acetylase OafA/YrhL